MSDYFPQEILMNILTRLPVKSFVNFICVSSSWNNLIKSSSFISSHLARQSHSHGYLLTYCTSEPTEKEHYTLHFNENSDPPNGLGDYLEFDLPYKSHDMFLRVLCSFNGIVCIVDDISIQTYTVILWNPSVRKSLLLPQPNVTYESHGRFQSVMGFGFYFARNDYKVVRIVYPVKKARDDSSILPEIEVFSLNLGAWKCVEGPKALAYYKFLDDRRSQALVNGKPHWLSLRKLKNGSFRNFVSLFEIGNEGFRNICLPDCLAEVFPPYLFISMVGESLAVNHNDADNQCCITWARKEYESKDSWTKLFRVRLLSLALGSWKKGHMLLQSLNGDIISYDYEGRRYKETGIKAETGHSTLWNHVESLVLLDKPDNAFFDEAQSDRDTR